MAPRSLPISWNFFSPKPFLGSLNLFCMANDEYKISDTLVSPRHLHLLILVFFLMVLVHVTGEQQGDMVREDPRKSYNDWETANMVHSHGAQESREAGGNKLNKSTTHLPGLVREEDLFNNTKHEVPSGPNPISNR